MKLARSIGVIVSIQCIGLMYATALAAPPYPPSELITGITFDISTLRNTTPGNGKRANDSDNWTITWADDGHQYTSFGDGIGFATSNSTRASLGVSRIEGGKDNYSAFDVFKTGLSADGWAGKSVGIVSVGGTLWMFRNGTGSGAGAYEQTELYKSTNRGSSWSFTGVRWTDSDFSGNSGFFSPTFLQFGRDYAGARDGYVYIYAPEETSSVDSDRWNVQKPGKISLIRVPKGSLGNQGAYEYFTGLSGGQPTWSSDVNARRPVFEDASNGVMRTSVSYNAGLRRYLLTTQQVNRFANKNFHIGIYEAPEPWGPWRTVLFSNAQNAGPGLNTGEKTVYWNFSNKWLSVDGRDFVLVYTGDGADEWGTVEGRFLVGQDNSDTSPPTAPKNLAGNAIGSTEVRLEWQAAADAESGIASYKVYRNGTSIGGTSQLQFTDTRAQPGTSYMYEVTALNGAGLEGQASNAVTVTTAAGGDTTPPTAASNLTATDVTANSVTLGWQAAQDPETGISHYSLYQNGSIVDTTTGTAYVVDGLQAGASYSYHVIATNGEGLQGPPSETISVTTRQQSDSIVRSTRPERYQWGKLRKGQKVYIDRSYEFVDIPNDFDGIDYLLTANDDKYSSGDSFVELDVAQPVTVYVGYDVLIDATPDWLKSWDKTTLEVGAQHTSWTIYKKDFPAGTIGLGGNEMGQSMYTALIIARQTDGDGGGGGEPPPVEPEPDPDESSGIGPVDSLMLLLGLLALLRARFGTRASRR